MNDTPGGETRTEAWLARLRERLLAVASRRVPAESVEDVVQDALRVIVQRRIPDSKAMRIDDLPPLAWCFQVLRNTIGNYYQKTRSRQRWQEWVTNQDATPAPTPLDALESDDATRAILAALAEMRDDSESCGRYLERLAAGISPADLARDEGLDAAVLYRRIYRCRHKLRLKLMERGILA